MTDERIKENIVRIAGQALAMVDVELTKLMLANELTLVESEHWKGHIASVISDRVRDEERRNREAREFARAQVSGRRDRDVGS